jgi:Protein of unknown function (DUF2846)
VLNTHGRAKRLARGTDVVMRKYLPGMPRLSSFVAMLFLSACSAAGPKFSDTPLAAQPVPADKARIIFFRGSDISFRSATVEIDGNVIGALARSGFIVADTEPGDRKVAAWLRYTPVRASAATMTVKAGEIYYIKISQRLERIAYPLMGPLGSAFWFVDPQGEFRIEPLVAAAALQALPETKLSK